MPTRVSSCGRSKISPNCRFQQTSVSSLSNTAMPWPHVIERGLQDFAVVVDRGIGVVEQLQRGLGRDRALAQQRATARAATTPRRSPRPADIRRIAGAGNRPRPCGVETRCAASPRSSRRIRGCAPRRDSARPSRSVPRPSPRRGAAESSARSAPASTARTNRACTRSIAVGRRPQRAADIAGDIDRETEQHAMHQRRQVEAEQRLRPQEGRAPTARRSGCARRRCRRRRCSAAAAYSPRPGCRRSCRRWRQARCRAARSGRRKTPARIAPPRRTTTARSRRAAPRRPSGNRCRRATG